jgi:hypothetical protein
MVRLLNGFHLSFLFASSEAVAVSPEGDEYYHTQLLQVKAKAEKVAKVNPAKGSMHNFKSLVAKQRLKQQVEQKRVRFRKMKEELEKKHTQEEFEKRLTAKSNSKLSKSRSNSSLAEFPFCDDYGNQAQTCLLCSATCVEHAKAFGCQTPEECTIRTEFHQCLDDCINVPDKIIDEWCEMGYHWGSSEEDWGEICHQCGRDCLSECHDELPSCNWGWESCQWRCTDKHIMARDPYMIEWCEFNWGEGVDGFQCLDCEWTCSDEVYANDDWMEPDYSWEDSHMKWIHCSEDCLERPHQAYQMCKEKFGEEVDFIQCDSCLWSCDCREYPGSEDYNLTCDESCAAECMGLGHGMQGEQECIAVYGTEVDVEHCVGCADGCFSAHPDSPDVSLSPDEWFDMIFQCMDECVGVKNHAVEECECQKVDMLTCFECSMECCGGFQGCSESQSAQGGDSCLDDCHARQVGSDSWDNFLLQKGATSTDESSLITDSTEMIQVEKHLK